MKNPTGNYHWTVVALLFFATRIHCLERQVIGLLKPTPEGEFRWIETDPSAKRSASCSSCRLKTFLSS